MAAVPQARAPGGAVLTERTREAIAGWLFIMPWVIGFLVFTVGPMAFSIYVSLTEYAITTDPKWVGLDNYTYLLTEDERFGRSLFNTFWMVLAKTPLVLVSALGIALLLNVDVPGSKFYRMIFYLPNVLAGVAAIYLWKWILQPNGLLNEFLGIFGISGPAWFSDPNWTKPGLVVMGMWWIGGQVLIFLAGLKGIPSTLYEAGELDGATGWRKTWYITIPMLSPTIFFQVVTSIIGTFQIFTTAYVLTTDNPAEGGPGPGSLLFYVLYLYNRAFGRTGVGLQMGYASAMAWILFFIILAITLFQLWLAKKWVYYETER